jgi:RAQPRD family integrative conjugative element protein
MKRKLPLGLFKLLLFVLGGFFCGHFVFAEDTLMKEALVKIIHQLEVIKPLLNEAERAQSLHPEIKIHFNAWRDANGMMHAGLRQDIQRIQTALIHIVNQERVDPRYYSPIKNDFIGQDHV